MTDVPGNAPLTKMKKKKIFPALLLSTSWWLLWQSAWLPQPGSIPGYQRINLLSIDVFQLLFLNKDHTESKVMITWRSRIWSHWFKVWNGAKHLAQRTWKTILEEKEIAISGYITNFRNQTKYGPSNGKKNNGRGLFWQKNKQYENVKTYGHEEQSGSGLL